MILGPASPNDILNHIKGLYEKLQSFQIGNLEECHKLFESKLKKLEEFCTQSTENKNLYAYYFEKLALAHFQSVNYQEADSLTEQLILSFPAINALYNAADTDLYSFHNTVRTLKEAYEYNCIYSKSTEKSNEYLKIISDNNLGNIFLCKNNFGDALFYFKRVLASIKNSDYTELKSSALLNISKIYFFQKNYEQALRHLQGSIELKRITEDDSGIAFCRYLLGKIHFSNKNFANAARNFQITINILVRLNNRNDKNNKNEETEKIGLAVCYILLAKASMRIPSPTGKKGSRNFRKAERYYETALNLAEDINENNLFLFVYKNYSEFYAGRKNSGKAKIFTEKYNRIENESREKNITTEINNYKKEAEGNRIKIANELKLIYETELSEITKAIRANDKTREDFFRDTIHDLKNPIGNVKQLIEYIIEGTDLTDEDREDFMQLILESADASLALITKLLDSSAIAHAKEINPVLEDFDINEHLNKIMRSYAVQIRNKSLNLSLQNTLEKNIVNTDKEILTHVLDNLISNAIKFSPKGKSIFITLSKECRYLKIIIKDEGPGFSEEDRVKLFKQFSKLSARPTGGEHSSGLGLSIVKKLTDSLQGFITCESEKGKGASMILKVPIEAS